MGAADRATMGDPDMASTTSDLYFDLYDRGTFARIVFPPLPRPARSVTC